MSGEYDSVWRELVGLGSGVHNSRVIEDATAVAQEIVTRCSFNLKTIHGRLIDLGYAFEWPDRAFVTASADSIRTIDALEAEAGTIPLLYRKWWETVDEVNFCQCSEQALHGPENLRGANYIMSVFMFSSVESFEEYRDQRHLYEGADFVPDGMTGFVPVGNGRASLDPYGFWVPEPSFDAEMYTPDESEKGVMFYEEMRLWKQNGGFCESAHEVLDDETRLIAGNPAHLRKLLYELTRDLCEL